MRSAGGINFNNFPENQLTIFSAVRLRYYEHGYIE